MNIKIKWLNENPGNPNERGFWRSQEGRFEISPNFRHTVNPDSYTVTDRLTKASCSHDAVRDAKAWAVTMVAKELASELGI